VDRLKVLPGVEVSGDRRDELEKLLGRLLRLWFRERLSLGMAAINELGRRGGAKLSYEQAFRDVVWARLGLPRTAPRSRLERLPAEERDLLVYLCLELLRSGDFAEIHATDEELTSVLRSEPGILVPGRDREARGERSEEEALPEYVGEIIEAVLREPYVAPVQSSVRRFLNWLRGGGPPSDGPGGTAPPPAVPV
jgi:hypothetical protein